MKKILDCLLAPFKVINHHKHDFFLWSVFVIFAGLLGVIINIIKRCVFDGAGFQEALANDTQAGSFYTFSLVICASLIWPIFKSITSKRQPEYSLIRTIFLTILMFSVLFSALFYALSSIAPHKWFIQVIGSCNTLDLPQCLFFVLAIVLSIYSFGLGYLPDHPNEYNVTDDHLTKENKDIRDTKEAIKKPKISQTSHSKIKL